MKITLKGLAVVAICLAAFGTQANSETWRLNNFLPETRPETPAMEKFVEEVNALTGDKFNLDIYNGGSLGLKNTDVLRFLPKGAVEMSLIWSNYLGRDAPTMSSVFIQGSLGSLDAYKTALPEIKAIYEEELENWGITPVAYLYIPMFSVSVFCKDKEVRTLDELRKVKLRVWAGDQIETFTKLGVAAQIIPQEEMYVAMRTGVVDCALYPPAYAHTVSLQEVSSYSSHLFRMASSPYILGVATDRWEALDPEIQNAITTAGEAMWAETFGRAGDDSLEQSSRGNLEKAGVTFLEQFPAEDREAFTAAVTQTWGTMTEEAGGKAPGYRERILSVLGRN